MKRIYLDNNATTPVAPEVLQTMLPFWDKDFGNPSSSHHYGETARLAIESARLQVATLLGAADSARVFFTSCGTEANNQALLSAIMERPEKKHIIASQVEHASVLAPLTFLQGLGYEIELFPVGDDGGIELAKLAAAIRPDTAVVSFMAANNETGVIFPIAAIGEICMDKNTYFHCDGVQLAGKEAIELAKLPIDYFSCSAHKLHGPKGIGALYVRPSVPLRPLLMGGGQEKGMRSGTENVGAIAGFGVATASAQRFLPLYHDQVGCLRDKIEDAITARFPDARIHGKAQPRLANTVNVSFRYVSAALIIQDLDERGYAVSAHAACHGGDLKPSHVLTAMRVPEEYLHGTMRISLSRFSRHDEIEPFLEALFCAVEKFRRL